MTPGVVHSLVQSSPKAPEFFFSSAAAAEVALAGSQLTPSLQCSLLSQQPPIRTPSSLSMQFPFKRDEIQY
jgi:hypothetical protein